MNPNNIYKLWLSKTSDHRYLRPNRWNVLSQTIHDHKVKTILEFGSGISTLLFSSLGLKIDSYETDPDYMAFVALLCYPGTNVKFHHWDNVHLNHDLPYYDMALVDGTLPREGQLTLSIKHSNLIAIDDFAGRIENMSLNYLTGYKRIDDSKTIMAIFEKTV